MIGRRKIAAENKMLRERLEECQVLLSALALESDGEFTVPADAFVKFSLAIDNEHAFVIARNDDGSVIVRFQPTAPAATAYANGPGEWTVSAGDVTAFAYEKVGAAVDVP